MTRKRWLYVLKRDKELAGIAANAVRKPYGVDIRQVAEWLADEGEWFGHNCFASPEYVAPLIGCSARTVEKYRDKLIELGWFRVTGRNAGDNHRSLQYDIAIPKGKDERNV